MPTLHLKLTPVADEALPARLAAALTRLTVELLGKREAVTVVMVETIAPTRWTVGGETLTQPSAWLEIRVTAGTNTAGQKARFIAAAHAELQRGLAPTGPLAPASYVIVHELPATDWGYGGQTQQARSLAQAAA